MGLSWLPVPFNSHVSRVAGSAFFGFLALLAAAVTWGNYWTLMKDVRAGRVQHIEGVVEDFRPALNSKAEESFTVGTQTFAYSAVALQQGFHTLSGSAGRPIRAGEWVRIGFVGKQIVRLETEQEVIGSLPGSLPRP